MDGKNKRRGFIYFYLIKQSITCLIVYGGICKNIPPKVYDFGVFEPTHVKGVHLWFIVAET